MSGLNGDAANVRTEALIRLEGALGRFGRAALDVVNQVRTILKQASETVHDRIESLEQQISSLEEQLDSADEGDDVEHLHRRLQEAAEALSRAQRRRRDLELSEARFMREAKRMTELATRRTAEARRHLKGLLTDLASYFALQNTNADRGGGTRGIGVGVEASLATHCERFDPRPFVLPHGFHWVLISEIATTRELVDIRAEDSFTKGISYEEMLRGFGTLRHRILPMMTNPNALPTSQTFAACDVAAGHEYGSGLQRVYDAFFGSDPIHLDRGKNDTLFSITSGRHRIRVALDAGWYAVPASTSDLKVT